MGTRSELKENVLASHVEEFLKWILEFKVQIGVTLGAVIFGVLLASVFYLRRQDEKEYNWTRLSQVQFLIDQKRYEEALGILDDVLAKTPNRSETIYATYMKGLVLLDEKKYGEAAELFRQVADKSGKLALKPLALVNLGFVQEEEGKYSDAAQTYQEFMDQFDDHFLAPRVQLNLGESLIKSGNADKAKEVLNQLIDLYPTSDWAENSRRILDKLKSR